MSQDRRSLFATGRVADAALDGTVEAPAYATPTPGQITAPVVDLCAAPDGARDRQLLWGQGIDVLETTQGWSFVRGKRDGYVGWIAEGTWGPVEKPTHRVSVPATHLYPVSNMKHRESHWLSFGSELRIVSGTASFFETSTGHFVPKPHIRPLNVPFEDWVTVAQLMFGVPYLWGGNSAAGIDCSGLVQAGLLAAGQLCPGDSDQQRAALGTDLAEDAPAQRGDLYFWKGHVAVAVDDSVLIHANAHHMAVAYEPIADARARIEAAEGPLLRRARLG